MKWYQYVAIITSGTLGWILGWKAGGLIFYAFLGR